MGKILFTPFWSWLSTESCEIHPEITQILTTLSPCILLGMVYGPTQRQITRNWYNIELYLQWPTNWKSYMIYRTTPFSMTPNFKVTPFFDAEYLRNGTTCRHSVIEILIGTYTRPTQQCHFGWSWVTLSDLAKYSVTWSVARSLCDSWASCSVLVGRWQSGWNCALYIYIIHLTWPTSLHYLFKRRCSKFLLRIGNLYRCLLSGRLSLWDSSGPFIATQLNSTELNWTQLDSVNNSWLSL